MLRRFCGLVLVLLCAVTFIRAATVKFAARQDITTNAGMIAGVTIADFNGDGHPDIAIGDSFKNTVTVYINDGSGGFPTSVVTSVPSTVWQIGLLLSGDVNEDGKQDLIVVARPGPGETVVLLGNGDGAFSVGGSMPSANDAVLVDVNGDKHLDVILAGPLQTSVAMGDGKGNFTIQPIVSTQFDSGVTAGDFTSDGHVDLVLSPSASFQMDMLRGNGDGTFQPPLPIQTGGFTALNRLFAVDMNGDGKLDLLVGGRYAGWLIFGNGDGTFQTGQNQRVLLPIPYFSTGGPVDASIFSSVMLAPADMDGDGTVDVVAADDNTQLLTVLLNDGTGKFAVPIPPPMASLDAGTAAVRVGDLNGDGLPDIVLTNIKTQKITIFLSAKTTPTVSVQSSQPQALAGNTVTVTTQVKSAGAKTATGTVTLTNGSSSYGQQTLDANGNATFTLSGLAAGQYSLTATYSGDKVNSAASSTAALSLSITDFQMSLASPAQSVASGASATYPVNLSPLSGFSGTVAVTCSGLPMGYTCSPVTATLNGQASAVSVVVSPPLTLATLDSSRTRTLALFASLGFWFVVSRRRRLPFLCLMTLAICACGAVEGCSSSSASSNPSPYRGTSNFTVIGTATQGSQSVAHQATATLTVQ